MSVPFTNDQLEYLAERDARIEENAGRGMRKGLRHLRNSALVGFLILLGGIGGAITTSQHDSDSSREAVVTSARVVSVDGCNRDFTTITRVRAVLVNAKKFQVAALKRGDISLERYADAIAYYDEQLSGLPLPDCRNAVNVITDDPTKQTQVPDPRYPADGSRGFEGPH